MAKVKTQLDKLASCGHPLGLAVDWSNFFSIGPGGLRFESCSGTDFHSAFYLIIILSTAAQEQVRHDSERDKK